VGAKMMIESMSVWPTGDILFYNFHPPDDVLLFTTPGAAVKRRKGSRYALTC
jgi:hypothetical protein